MGGVGRDAMSTRVGCGRVGRGEDIVRFFNTREPAVEDSKMVRLFCPKPDVRHQYSARHSALCSVSRPQLRRLAGPTDP